MKHHLYVVQNRLAFKDAIEEAMQRFPTYRRLNTQRGILETDEDTVRVVSRHDALEATMGCRFDGITYLCDIDNRTKLLLGSRRKT